MLEFNLQPFQKNAGNTVTLGTPPHIPKVASLVHPATGSIRSSVETQFSMGPVATQTVLTTICQRQNNGIFISQGHPTILSIMMHMTSLTPISLVLSTGSKTTSTIVPIITELGTRIIQKIIINLTPIEGKKDHPGQFPLKPINKPHLGPQHFNLSSWIQVF